MQRKRLQNSEKDGDDKRMEEGTEEGWRSMKKGMEEGGRGAGDGEGEEGKEV